MASRPNTGKGITPLPTPQQQAKFMAALLAPLPPKERGDVNEIVAARQAREDRNSAWFHVLRALHAAHMAFELAQHERMRWIHDYWTGPRPAGLIEAERVQASRSADVVRIMAALVATPAQSRTQALDKQKAYTAHTRGVTIAAKVRERWEAALAAEVARFPVQPKRKAARA